MTITAAKPIKPRWRRRMALASFCLLLAWYAVPGEPPAALLGLRINGNPMIVPVSYIPRLERGLYWQGQDAMDGLHIAAEWTGGRMRPFFNPENNEPVWLTHHDKYGIMLSNFRNNSFEERRQLAVFFAFRLLLDRHADSMRHGLLRLVHKDVAQRELEHDLGTYTERDLYLYPSREQIDTMIICTPDFFPDPYTPRALELQRQGKFVLAPMCSHDMFMHDLNNTAIRISYYRIHLPHWREIEEAVRELLRTFEPPPGALHYERPQRMPGDAREEFIVGLPGK